MIFDDLLLHFIPYMLIVQQRDILLSAHFCLGGPSICGMTPHTLQLNGGGHGKMARMLGKRDRVSIRCLSDLLGEAGARGPNSFQSLRNQLMRETDIHTPQGPLFRQVNLPLKTGGMYRWEYVNSPALLWLLCNRFYHVADFMQSHLGRCQVNVAFYSDEAIAGNNKRPQAPKHVGIQCIYYTFQELPYWFRARYGGWMPIGYLSYATQKQIKGSVFLSNGLGI